LYDSARLSKRTLQLLNPSTSNTASPNAKGRFLSGGISGIVELLPSDHVIKSPHGGSLEDDCRKDVANEAEIYLHLGKHARLVPMTCYTAKDGLCLEYMSNGDLRDYIYRYNVTISLEQRQKWACEAVEGLQVLHSANVIHGDPKPPNFLLDASLGLRIADFGHSSIGGSQKKSVGTDLSALGSTIYEIMTGTSPYEELGSSEAKRLFKAQEFPDMTGILCGEYIRQCWLGKVNSAQEVHDIIKVGDIS
jgi:serine/threonine protein kinase